MGGCINSTFADGSGTVEERMALYKRRKDEAQGVLHALFMNPGTGDGSDRPLDDHPACTWACVWPLTPEARGDASALCGYHRQYLSVVCHTRGELWLPYVMLERMLGTGVMILNSALGFA